MPRLKISGSGCGEPFPYTLAGPPERISPLGLISRMRDAGRSCRTIWQKTLFSRTRRAISCAVCDPKSSTKTCSATFAPMACAAGFIVVEFADIPNQFPNCLNAIQGKGRMVLADRGKGYCHAGGRSSRSSERSNLAGAQGLNLSGIPLAS